MHPELVYRLAQLRREELINGGHRRRTRADGRAFWRRRRSRGHADAMVAPARLVPRPPPRAGREPTGDDRRVA